METVTPDMRREAIELAGVAYPLDRTLVVEVEGGAQVEGAPCVSVYVGSPHERTTSTMALFAVNLDTNAVFLLDRVTGTYGLVASVPDKEKIDAALAEIQSSPLEASNPEAYLDAHPDAVRTILDVGDAAMPYLLSIHDNGDRGLRGVLARELCLRIHPGLNLMTVVSPDARFRMEAFGVDTDMTAGGMYPANGIRLVEQETDRVRWAMEPGYYRSVCVWSPDGRYAALYVEARIYGTTMLLDTTTMEPIELPGFAELQKHAQADITERSFRPDPYFEVTRWVNDRQVEIRFVWVGEKVEEVRGTFVFDVESRSMVRFAMPE